MEVHIFDVEHGSCAAIMTPSGHLMMIDAGHNGTTGWRPSEWVKGRYSAIECLVVTNFDEDHVTDLPNLWRTIPIHTWVMNWHVTAEWVRREKAAKGGMGPGVARAVAQLDAEALADLPLAAVDQGTDVARRRAAGGATR